MLFLLLQWVDGCGIVRTMKTNTDGGRAMMAAGENDNPVGAVVSRYGSRNWAVHVCGRLVCVCVYKKGAANVAAVLNAVHANVLALTVGAAGARS